MIRKLDRSDIDGLNKFPPKSWKFDYEAFLDEFIDKEFFYAFVKIQDSKIVGTGNVFVKGHIAWLANILVDENYRGQGFGREITKFLSDFSDAQKCETQLLIATELGEPVYKKIGFKNRSEYVSFDSTQDVDFKPSTSIKKLDKSDLNRVCKLDEIANAENRTHLIEMHFENAFGYLDENEQLIGFYLPHFGRGLVIALEEQAGIELLKLKHSKKGTRTLLPIENKIALAFFEKNGFPKGDSCTRMILGKENPWAPKYIYSYGGGYCG
ncbi:MAG: GNAT family N-acetyltransferase [Bacteroidetes bacterium]|nr:MAG: GNAT family N-acetyltransferase [Bacteroidota bacterium]